MRRVKVRVEYEATFEGYIYVPDDARGYAIREKAEEEARLGMLSDHEFEGVVGFEILEDED